MRDKMKNKKEADYYQKIENNRVKCFLCPHNCKIAIGESGKCMVRKNEDGKLFTKNYGKVSSTGIDPVEKKPLYHFHPGKGILSLGTFGCNFSCGFCQNWRISQKQPPLRKLLPKEAVEMAGEKDVFGIAYTYSEPMVWFEYLMDTCELAKKKNIKNVLITNGYINSKPLKDLLPLIDAANVDLKAFQNNFYNENCDGDLKPVLNTIEMMYKANIHIEITTLLIPGLNDESKELVELFSWIANLNSEIPLHISRYFPGYRSDIPPTPIKKLKKAYKIARKYLDYVYLGNIGNDDSRDTDCPDCGYKVIERNNYDVAVKLDRKYCSECGRKII